MDRLEGITFGGYRSFGSDTPVRLRHLTKINLVVGQNNSGKSNVLRAIRRLSDKNFVGDIGPDRPHGEGEHLLSSGYALNVATVLDRLKTNVSETTLRAALENTPALEDGQIWFEFDGWVARSRPLNLTVSYHERVKASVTEESERSAARALRAFGTSVTRFGENVLTLLGQLHKLVGALPPAEMVAGFREITHADDAESQDLNGGNLRRRLQKLQSPSLDQLGDRGKFDTITHFVRAVLEDDEITIDIPHDLSTILVTQRGLTLPIESLGTGIHEVVIIAAAATVVDSSLVCIEEPEIHLHPVLQRKLLRYLATETTNQYFIATHSAHMLDSSLGSIHHVQHVDGRSQVDYVGVAADQSRVCVDLGYRPSDLVQSNAVIWVEGPSDRLYVIHWIQRRAPGEFVEGVHYSVMFYGGALLSELTPDDPSEVDEFISLRRLNRYMAVLIDSDKTSARKRINPTKSRVIEALAGQPGTSLAWVTKGYTIENYVPWPTLDAAIAAAHPRSNRASEPPEQFENPLTTDRVGTTPNKSRIARHVVANWNEEWPLDLADRVDEILALIREANRTA